MSKGRLCAKEETEYLMEHYKPDSDTIDRLAIHSERIIYINDYIKDTYKILCITENTRQTVEVIGNIHENPELLEVANAD